MRVYYIYICIVQYIYMLSPHDNLAKKRGEAEKQQQLKRAQGARMNFIHVLLAYPMTSEKMA